MDYFVCVKFVSDGISYSIDTWQKQLLHGMRRTANCHLTLSDFLAKKKAFLKIMLNYGFCIISNAIKLCVKEANLRSKQNLFEFIKYNMGSALVEAVLNWIRKMQKYLVYFNHALLDRGYCFSNTNKRLHTRR